MRALAGPIDELVDATLAAARGGDVYVDAGELIRAVLDAGRSDELVVTTVPVVLGAGVRLFAPGGGRREFELRHAADLGAGLVQRTYRPSR